MTTVTISKGAPFSATLNSFIAKEYQSIINGGLKVEFVPGQPYERFEDMKDDVHINNRMRISTDFSYNTIFGDGVTNWMFRAVHDMQHIRLNKDFSHASEYYITYQMIKEYRAKGLSQYDIDLLTIEMNGQISYHLDTQDFPDNQREFTAKELNELGYNVVLERGDTNCNTKEEIAKHVLSGTPIISYKGRKVNLPEPQTKGTQQQAILYANMVADIVAKKGTYYN